MSAEWRELESDPGLFTLLIRDFGVKGVEVEEIYDLGREIEGPVYGFIFLANWSDDGNWRRRNAGRDVCAESGTFIEEAETVNGMFFAHQVVTNACATYALLSVLLNCPDMELGSLLGGIKEFTEGFDPESKGYAIANLRQLKVIHNRHARPVYPQLNLPCSLKRKSRTSYDRTVFHYSSYVPLNGRLMELDGLKVCPVDHGPVMEGDSWISAFKTVISKRIEVESGSQNSIQFNLLAVKPERLMSLETRLLKLQDKWRNLTEDIEKVLNSFPYKSVDPYELDQSVMDCDEVEDAKLCVGSFSQRLQMLLKRCHPSEFPHVFACATPCSENGVVDDTAKEQRPGHTELAPLYSIISWLEVLHAHNVEVPYSANTFMGMSETQLIDMTPPSACQESGIETQEKDNSVDHTYSFIKHEDGGQEDESSSDETIIDMSMDSDMVECATDAEQSLGGVKNMSISNVENQNCHTKSVLCDPLINGTDGESPQCSSADMDCVSGCVSENCMSGSVAAASWFAQQLSEDAQFETSCAHIAKLECEIQQLQKLIQDEKEKRDRYNMDFLRRTQDYQPFIEEYLKMVYRAGILQREPDFQKAQQQQQAAKAPSCSRRHSSSSRQQKQKRLEDSTPSKVWSTTICNSTDTNTQSNEDKSTNSSD